MNSLAAPIHEEQEEPTWLSEHWPDPPTAAISSGTLDSRHLRPGRQDWDWDQMILPAQYAPGDQNIDCKPSTMQFDALGSAGPRQYNGVLPASFPAIPLQNSWAMLSAGTIRHNVGLERSSANLPTASNLYGSLESLGGFPGYTSTGSNYLGEPRSPLEQRHFLGLMNIDHRRNMNDIVRRGLYSSPDFNARIGLNLGGRTYFSEEDSALARLGKRFRPNCPAVNVPLCQAQGCRADLSLAKHYHRRHKVCEYHSKVSTAMISGQTQRFCQQCSRFHVLAEFDEGKRSCRKRLADHNRRRRKPQPNASTITSFTPDSVVKPEDDDGSGHDGAPAANQNHGSCDQSQSLLSAISLAPSIALTLKNGKTQMETMTLEKNEKETYPSFLQGAGLNGPSLSLSTLGGGNQNQSAQETFRDADLSVPWLRNVGSKMESFERSGVRTVNPGMKDNDSPSGHFMENAPHDRHQLDRSMQGKTEGQTVLSLLEGRANKDNIAVEKISHESGAKATLGFLQQQDVIQASASVPGGLQASKFHEIPALRPLNESMYSTADFFLNSKVW